MNKTKKRVAMAIVAACMVCSLAGNVVLTMQNNELKGKVKEAHDAKGEQSVAYESDIKELEQELTVVKKDYNGYMQLYDMSRQESELYRKALSGYVEKEAETQGFDHRNMDWLVDDDGHVKFWYYE